MYVNPMAKRKTKKRIRKKKKEESPLARGILFVSLSLLFFLSLLAFSSGQNILGLLGQKIGWTLTAFFGIGSYFIVAFMGWYGWRNLFHKSINAIGYKLAYFALLVASSCILLNLVEDRAPSLGFFLHQLFYPSQVLAHYHLGGAPLYYLYHDLPNINLFRVFDTLGTSLIFSTTLLISLFVLFKIRLKNLYDWASQRYSEWKDREVEEESDDMRFVKVRSGASPTKTKNDELLGIQPERDLTMRPSLSQKKKTEVKEPYENREIKVTDPEPPPPSKREKAIESQRVYNGDYTAFKLPAATHLSSPKTIDQSSLKKNLKRQAEVLEETLASFGIEAKVGQINCGPTITSFEVHPAIGVKVQKIKALDSDIALNMEAQSIRIIAPIPGKAAVGIEVPNSNPQEVAFKDMLHTYQRSSSKCRVPLLLGKAVNGDYVMSDLTKMPHLIIAGATGSGKSVCINTIIMSIIMNARPDEIKLLMVDPKKVELTPYAKLPHMLAPVITEPQGACTALKWLVKEMENRYEIFKLLGCRNIDAFNGRKIDEEKEAQIYKEIPKRLPYIVGIIDELADLMMVASNDIETPIARIAQMARAVGIHLILATQRPSREVITGIIKANFPTRISFKVASRINSQIVLDETGAESLLGNGDMLFLPPGSSHLIRAQGSFIRDEDINRVVDHVCAQSPPNYVIESFDQMRFLDDRDLMQNVSTDSLYDQALDTILSTGNASTTFLQRKLKIGYARAASIVDQLEMKGVIGPAEGSKPRKILIKQNETSSDDEA